MQKTFSNDWMNERMRVRRQVCPVQQSALQTSLQTAGKLWDLFDYNGINNETKAHVWEENRGKCHREPD